MPRMSWKVLEAAHVSLMSKYEQQYNADYIAEYAENTLGMVSTSQIEYIELARQEGIDVTSSARQKIGGVVGFCCERLYCAFGISAISPAIR